MSVCHLMPPEAYDGITWTPREGWFAPCGQRIRKGTKEARGDGMSRNPEFIDCDACLRLVPGQLGLAL